MKLFLKCFLIFIITLSIFLFNKKVYRLDAIISTSQIPVSSYLQYLTSYVPLDNKDRVSNQQKRVEFQYEFNESSKKLYLRYVSADMKSLENIAYQLELSSMRPEELNALNDWPKWSIESIKITDQSPSYLSIALTLCTLLSIIALILV